ncbi:MAG: hypothetical protein ACPGLV_07235 [Bacteroidia bacterium]
MKWCFVSIFFLVAYIQLKAQINSDSITLNGLDFQSTSFKIKKVNGPPIDSFKLNYDCVFLFSAQGEKPFWCLNYGYYSFAGNNEFGFVLKQLIIDSQQNQVLHFYGNVLNKNTSKKQFQDLLFKKLDQYFIILPDSGTIINYKNSDDGLIFTFKNDRLYKVEYYSPC